MATIDRKRKKYFVVLALWVICSMFFMIELTQAKPNQETNVDQDVIASEINYSAFENRLETVRQTLKIPGMSAAIVRDQELVWASGFGYADLENKVPATPDTVYGLASVTKPVAAVLIMQLVEEGLVDLDAPISKYGVNLLGDHITVRHLMTHTSEGVPGTVHNYNGSRYGILGGVIEGATGKSFAENLSERILLPLEMKSTALNPINYWGGSSLSGIRDFMPALGWGSDFEHYPEVYTHLSAPYQFDDRYDIIPGMYQLYHNPAAGLNASVVDLAKFDMALDQGLLLDEPAKEEMFSPAVSTHGIRQDMMYGLGWYVQEFDGLQLLWHTGRWHPSTSALYLKIPAMNLTFIVLANTTNLTTPFDGIGYGDISKSLLALSFYNHLVFPEKYGSELPVIGWGAEESILVNQLSTAEGLPTREFLERELWAYRQAYASSGQTDQAGKLMKVNLRAFPDSTMRSGKLFTNIVGAFPVVQPGFSATDLLWMSRGIVFWFILIFLSLVWMFSNLIRQNFDSKILWSFWLLSTVFLGPVSVLIFKRQETTAGNISLSKRGEAWILSAFLVGIYAIGWGVSFSLLPLFGSNPSPPVILVTTYLIPMIFGFIAFQILFLYSWSAARIKERLLAGLAGVFTSMNIAFAVMFPLLMLLNNMLTTIPAAINPFFWAILSFISLVNLITQYPVNTWMIQRGLIACELKKQKEQNEIFPATKKSTWPVLMTSLFILFSSLGITISQLA